MPLIRSIGRWTMTALVINTIIGSGVFGLPAELTRLLGRASPFAIILGALGVAAIMACMAEVASQFSQPGGPYHLVFGWHIRAIGGVIWQVLLGALYIGIGAYLLVHPVAGLATLTLALAIYLFAEGLLELILSFRIRPRQGWGWLLADGIVTLILAIMIWQTWPASTEWIIGTLVGISMIFSGASRLMLSLAARSLVTKLA